MKKLVILLVVCSGENVTVAQEMCPTCQRRLGSQVPVQSIALPVNDNIFNEGPQQLMPQQPVPQSPVPQQFAPQRVVPRYYWRPVGNGWVRYYRSGNNVVRDRLSRGILGNYTYRARIYPQRYPSMVPLLQVR